MIKKCKDCGTRVGNDRKTGKYWCPKCKDVKDSINERYKIVLMGKNAGIEIGRYNFINQMGKSLEKLGHEIVYINDDYLFKLVPQYDFANCFHYKKKINIKQIQYENDPDFIYIEQMYNRFDISEITCPVIYQHREYTHFPDVDNPNILLASYYWRLRAFEFYRPYNFHRIPYKQYLYIAVNPEMVKPEENKTIEGIYHIGWHLPYWQFSEANGPFAEMIIEDQRKFAEKCVKKGYVGNIPEGMGGDEFIQMLRRCECVLYDAGRLGGISRRLFEAMAAKTVNVIRVHSDIMKGLYQHMGITDEMAFFIENPKDILKIKYTDEERKEMADKAYEWVINNHTYDIRVKQLIDIFEEYKKGIKKDIKFMGWAVKHRITHQGDSILIE